MSYLTLNTSLFLWHQSFHWPGTMKLIYLRQTCLKNQLKNKILPCPLEKSPKATHTFPRHGPSMHRKLTTLGPLDPNKKAMTPNRLRASSVHLNLMHTSL